MIVPNPVKIAFLFLMQRDLHQGSLWQNYLSDAEKFVNVYAHCSFPASLNGFIKSFIIPSIPTLWGDLSLVRATILLLSRAYECEENEFFVLVSESCIPVVPFDEIYYRLFRKAKSVCHAVPLAHEDIPPILRMAGYGGHVWKQSQWMILNRAHVRQILNGGCPELWIEWPVPDEAYFISTLSRLGVNIKDEVELSGSTWTRWLHPRSSSPLTFDWFSPATLTEIEQSGALFVRKVHSACDLESVKRKILIGSKIS